MFFFFLGLEMTSTWCKQTACRDTDVASETNMPPVAGSRMTVMTTCLNAGPDHAELRTILDGDFVPRHRSSQRNAQDLHGDIEQCSVE